MTKRENDIEIGNIKKKFQAGTTHLYLGLRLRMHGVMPLLPPIFSHGLHRDKYVFSIYPPLSIDILNKFPIRRTCVNMCVSVCVCVCVCVWCVCVCVVYVCVCIAYKDVLHCAKLNVAEARITF